MPVLPEVGTALTSIPHHWDLCVVGTWSMVKGFMQRCLWYSPVTLLLRVHQWLCVVELKFPCGNPNLNFRPIIVPPHSYQFDGSIVTTCTDWT
jgi:hypothetical protein